ncbi:MAG: DUF3047 domain-containing protein [Betaproteobacteria bacterium]
MTRAALVIGLIAAAFEACAQVPEPPRFSTATAGAIPTGWQAVMLSSNKQPTEYTLVADEGVVVLKASARSSASLLAWRTDFDPRAFPLLSWRWKVTRPIAGADTRERRSEDSPARVMISFSGNAASLRATDRAAGALAQAISGHALPYAVLMYVWGAKVPPESTTVSALTSRIRMIAVASDEEGIGRWQSYRRNLAEDFRRVFGEEPGRVTAIELMTDTDNTGGVAETFYGDLAIAPTP